jgi:predicted amidohydrolase
MKQRFPSPTDHAEGTLVPTADGPERRGLRLAMLQMTVTGGDLSGNLARAEAMIAEAAAHGSDLALLPEAMDLGWTHPAAATMAGAIPGGEACQRLAHAARRHRIHVCAGLTEQAGEQVYNAAVLLGPDGALLGLHRKINELEIGHSLYAPGDRLQVVHTPLGAIGLMICADGLAKDQVLTRALGYLGADIVLSPCAWAVEPGYDHAREPYGHCWRQGYGPVARDFHLWIVGVSNVGPIAAGPWAGRNCIGCSMAVGPDGKPFLTGPYGTEAILYADLVPVPRPARGCGWLGHWRQPPS